MRIQTLLTVLIVTLFAASTTMPINAQADDAASLLAKHRAFVGWQYGDGSVQSMQLDRTYTDGAGKVWQHATEKRIGIAYRRDYQGTEGHGGGGSTGFTGNIFWTTNDNGFTVPMIGDTARYYLAVDALFMEGSSELPATLQNPTTIGGKNVDVVRITMNGALPYDVYEDPQTGAFVQAVIDPGGSQETPVTIDLANFTPRAPVKLDDKFEMMATLDTGASDLVLMSNQVEHHGINLLANRTAGGNAIIGGVGGYELTTCGPLARLAFGPFIYTGTEACESPAWGLHDGLLGLDFLRHFDYVIDYPQAVMYITPH